MIAGSMVALVTPMDAQGRLDWDSLSKLVDFHLENGTHAIVAVGTTGESATLDVEEHIKVIEFVVKRVNGRIPVIAGTGANSTSEAVHLTRNAKNAGVDACLLMHGQPPLVDLQHQTVGAALGNARKLGLHNRQQQRVVEA